ncbi:MAG: DNA gyrase subunit A [Pseudomonadota bacterium]
MAESMDGGARPALPVNIEDEMRSAYLDYSMSVIVGRALPDVRDGMKPVLRRILFAMYDEGLLHSKKHSKCAGVVGEVLKKYHPHGDSAVYDALVRLAQPWNLRYPLIDGQGNFGSVDGDPAAAYRYTEARLKAIAEEMLADIDEETVDFLSNYDDSTQEPAVLPAKLPNLLVNGSEGIAVGMATKMPPHNLGEIIDGCLMLLDRPQTTVRELMQVIPGPDFPTGAFICGTAGIRQAYESGRGTVKMRAKCRIEETAKGREQIIIDEIPFQVNKARLVERIAELVHDKRIEGISDVRDESDREGMRVVIELKRDAISEVVLNGLYKHTALQSSFGIINLAIVGGQPRVMTLAELISLFLDHRREVVTRRSRFRLRKAQERFHLLAGLVVAVDAIDRVIEIIRSSPDSDTARVRLCAEKFSGVAQIGLFTSSPTPQIEGWLVQGFANLDEDQAKAILEMRLSRLTGLEREKLLSEGEDLKVVIAELQAILDDPTRLKTVIREELTTIRATYNDPRRTVITTDVEEFVDEDLIAEEEMVVTFTHAGYLKRTPLTAYRAQRRGGRGRGAARPREEDFVSHLFVASTHAFLLCFSDLGKVYWLKVHALPEASPQARGKAIVNLLQLSAGENVRAVLPVREFEEGKYILTCTRGGTVKKTSLMEYANPRSVGLIACGINEGDALIGAYLTSGDDDIVLATRTGMAIRFNESEVRSMGRAAVGVRGIALEDQDAVVGSMVLQEACPILTVTENGYGKRTRSDEYRVQGRGGKGIITIKANDRNGSVVGVVPVLEGDEVMVVTDRGRLIRTKADNISIIGRNTQGVRIMPVDEGERVVSVARIEEQEDVDGDADALDAAVLENAGPEDADSEPQTSDLDASAASDDGEDDSDT